MKAVWQFRMAWLLDEREHGGPKKASDLLRSHTSSLVVLSFSKPEVVSWSLNYICMHWKKKKKKSQKCQRSISTWPFSKFNSNSIYSNIFIPNCINSDTAITICFCKSVIYFIYLLKVQQLYWDVIRLPYKSPFKVQSPMVLVSAALGSHHHSQF